MMLSGQAPDTASYQTVSSIPDEIDKTTYPQTYFERGVNPEKVMQLSGEIRNLVKTDIAQRVRDKFRGEGEIYGDENTQGGAEDEDVEGDGMEDDGEMEGDLEDFGGETEA